MIRLKSSSLEVDRIAQEFDGDACEFCERYKNKGLSRSSKLLLRFIVDNNVRDRSVLDLGCGAGGLSFELLKEGANFTVGFDLSPKMISAALELAKANGLESRARFQLGNGATSELPGCVPLDTHARAAYRARRCHRGARVAAARAD